MNVSISQRSGSFDFVDPSREEWEVRLRVDTQVISELFDTEQDIDDLLPSEVARMLLERANRYLYNSSRYETQKKADWIFEHADEVNDSYLRAKIAGHKRKIDRLESRLSLLEEQ